MTASASSTGLLSQAIQNLKGMSQHLAALTGLPTNAKNVETTAVGLLQAEIVKILPVQSAIKQFVTNSLPNLQKAKTDLDSGTNLDQVVSIITQVNTSATSLKQNVETLSSDINATKDKIIALSKSLAPIESDFKNQSITLNTQLQSAQQEAAAIRSKEKYFLALGVLGLVGLAAAAIALKVEENKVNGLLTKASGLRAQLVALKILIQSVSAMTTDFLSIINGVSNIKNAVAFTSSDITEIINDLKNSQGGQVKAKLYIITTISQLNTLANDAS